MESDEEPTSSHGILGIGSGMFAGAGLGCGGAVVAVLLTAAAMLGLVAMVWWGR
jgi:hypothetical protein